MMSGLGTHFIGSAIEFTSVVPERISPLRLRINRSRRPDQFPSPAPHPALDTFRIMSPVASSRLAPKTSAVSTGGAADASARWPRCRRGRRSPVDPRACRIRRRRQQCRRNNLRHKRNRQNHIPLVVVKHLLNVIRRRAKTRQRVVADQIRGPLHPARIHIHKQRRITEHIHQVRIPLYPAHKRRITHRRRKIRRRASHPRRPFPDKHLLPRARPVIKTIRQRQRRIHVVGIMMLIDHIPSPARPRLSWRSPAILDTSALIAL